MHRLFAASAAGRRRWHKMPSSRYRRGVLPGCSRADGFREGDSGRCEAVLERRYRYGCPRTGVGRGGLQPDVPPVCRHRVPTRAHFVPVSTVPVPSRRRFMAEVCPVRGPAQVRCTDYSELIECDRSPNGTVPKLRRGPRERALRGGVRGFAARASGRCLFPPRGAG